MNSNNTPMPRNLKARYVFPVATPPIPDGVVVVEGRRIVAVGNRPADGPVEDLGNVAILPGLVNAHTHLEFSHLAAPLGEQDISFADWLRRVIAARRDAPGPSPAAVAAGIAEAVRLGTTALGEIAQPGWSSEAFRRVPLEATVFLELIAPTAGRVDQASKLAADHLAAGRGSANWRPGLAPHAPYSVHAALLQQAVALSKAARAPLAFHLAESREELELLGRQSGPLRDFLESLDVWDADPDRFYRRPMAYLRVLTDAHRALVIHGNYLDDEEIAFLARHRQRMSVVYCPRTHAWFAHEPYPLEEMLAAGVAVALGTDSRASSPDLSVLAEMRQVAQRHPGISGAAVLEMATLGGARALGRARQFGSLEPGKHANLTVVSLPDCDAADPHDLLLHYNMPVLATYYHGL